MLCLSASLASSGLRIPLRTIGSDVTLRSQSTDSQVTLGLMRAFTYCPRPDPGLFVFKKDCDVPDRKLPIDKWEGREKLFFASANRHPNTCVSTVSTRALYIASCFSSFYYAFCNLSVVGGGHTLLIVILLHYCVSLMLCRKLIRMILTDTLYFCKTKVWNLIFTSLDCQCLFFLENPLYIIFLPSTNGTFINGEKIGVSLRSFYLIFN